MVLASGSAARRALMQAAGLAFRVIPADVDEAAIKAAMAACPAEDAALALADAKAASIQDSEALVIGADQILVCGTDWFDKPADVATARDHLLRLRGREHRLVTAVVCWRGGRRFWSHVAQPALRMRPFSDAFLDMYVAAEGEALLGSVGAYRLEGLGIQLFDTVAGEYAAVLGLPMLELLGFLRREGVLVG
jgi:septum formation protein